MGYALEKAEEEARKAIAPALKSLRIPSDSIPIREAAQGFGDLACPIAFAAAKELKGTKKAPQQIAGEIAARISEGGLPASLEKVSAQAGFVNFWLSQKFFSEAVGEAAEFGKKYGETPEGAGQTAVIDYSAPNVGKPLHIGHIRSTVYGDAVKRLLAATGYQTVGFNYVGDAGKQVAELVVALRHFKNLPAIRGEKDLLEYYVKINKEIGEKPELEEEVRKVMAAIEAAEEKVLGEVAHIRKLSFAAFDKTYAELGVKFDETSGESFFMKAANAVVDEALKKGAAEGAKDGEIVALLEKKGLPNTILRRSNGTTLYFTRDLALADYKWEKYKFGLSFYATAAEQNLHFRQVFAFLSMLGRPYAARCAHTGFGLITLPEGKMSTREGRVVLLEDVMSEAIGSAREEVESRLGQLEERLGRKYSKADVDEIAKQVGVGSLKFAVLRVSPEKGIMFDFKKMVSFDGDTGAYLQYTFVRAANILRKAEAIKGEKDAGEGAAVEWQAEEKKVARTVSLYPRVVSDSAKSFKPHILCDYLLRVAGDFSSFYENCPVLKSEGAARARRLRIVKAVETVLGNGLALLGIAALQKM